MQYKYSVLMSVYDKEKPEWLRMSINSILMQTVSPDEIVIVKDGPLTLDLDEVISSFCELNPDLFKIIALKKNIGLGPALAEGIMHCKNELIARMDSDDISMKERCEKEIQCFSKDPDLQIVGCLEAEFINSIDNIIAIHKVPEMHDDIEKMMKKRCALLHPTVMFKKNAILQIGNYHNVKLYEDYDLFSRLIFGGYKGYNLQETLYYIRISPEFFKRRGGVEYLKTVIQFKNSLRKHKFMSNMDFMISAGGQALVCLLPNKMREWFYMTVLR